MVEFRPSRFQFFFCWFIVNGIVKAWGEGSWEDHSNPDAPHEANVLKLDISKAKSLLGWSPVWNIDKAIAETVAWYRQYHTGDMYKLCCYQIIDYMSDKSKSR
jgi:CDP-glucose 4,6-dehydratase